MHSSKSVKILPHRTQILLAIGSALLLILILWFYFTHQHRSPSFRTAQVRRGDLLVSVSATGTVEPEEVVDIGAQVAGKIDLLGNDQDGKIVDYGSVVQEGAVLAHIDESLYAADGASADAQVKRAKADLLQMQAKLIQADQDWKRAQKLGPSDALSQSSYDGYKAAYDVAKATVGIGEAAVAQAEAALTKAQQNITYCTIKSPVSGVVIDRRVNIGQTVVSSLNAPSLFLLAKDLKKMEVWIAVNEADIGNIHPGQNVNFTVDTFPGENFQGSVAKIRLNATMTQNVVTYTVEVHTDNSSGKLLPYLTANAQFEVSNKKNVLLVPNAALRWSPKGTQATDLPPSKPHDSKKRGVIWIANSGATTALEVEVGGSDGVESEVIAAQLQEGTEVVIGDAESTQAAGQDNSSPFAPKVFRGKR